MSCTRCGGVTYCSDCDADHWDSTTPDQEIEWLRARVDRLEAELDLDARLTRARVAMDEGPIPGVEPYPLPTVGDPPLSEHDRALRAGGRVVPLEERIRRLIEAHDYAVRMALVQDGVRAALRAYVENDDCEYYGILDSDTVCSEDCRRCNAVRALDQEPLVVLSD